MSQTIPNIAALGHYLEIEEALVDDIRRLLNGYRDFYCEIMARPAVDQAPSPVLCFVEATQRGVEPPLLAMAQYAQSAIEPCSGKPFIEVIGMHEFGVRKQILEMLPQDAVEILDEFGDFSLLDIDTGYDPFRELLSDTMQAVLQGTYVPPAVSDQQIQRGQELFCPAPFEYATVDQDGHVFLCCPAWLTRPAGNLAEQSWDEIWNSADAQEIRSSILDASFKFCSEANCPHLRGQTGRLARRSEVTDPYLREVIEQEKIVLDRGPEDVTVQYDPTCNLSCPSCRCDMYKSDKEEAARTRRVHERVWTELVGSARRLTIAGNGDPFASKLYRDALRAFDPAKFPGLKIALVTNGLLLTPSMWRSIENCHTAIESVHVSFNATTPETFRINQRGGEIEKLFENLGPLSAARRAGEFPLLSLGFYVLDNNVREMRAMIEIGKQFQVDRVLFGHYMPPPYQSRDDPDYLARAVHLPQHPLHQELLDILRDPAFLDPMIAMTNVTPLLPARDAENSVSDSDASTPALCSLLGLSPSKSSEVNSLLDRFAADFSELLFRVTAEGAPSPGQMIAGLLDGDGRDLSEEQRAALEDYALVHIEPLSGVSYASALRELEKRLRRELLSRLDAAERARLSALPLLSLLDLIETRAHFLERVRAAAQTIAATR